MKEIYFMELQKGNMKLLKMLSIIYVKELSYELYMNVICYLYYELSGCILPKFIMLKYNPVMWQH